jgi:glutamate synthase domain-containing protein 3
MIMDPKNNFKENIADIIEFSKKARIKFDRGKCIIDAQNTDYKMLNSAIRNLLSEIKLSGRNNLVKKIELNNVLGQRYIGDGIQGKIHISINGTPGNDLAVFMDGPEIEIFGNVQDGTGNTMNSGKVIIHGSAGDILGYSMRGGEIYVMQDVGYRSGIHMKSYLDKFPVIVIGGKAGHFLGEYMAGGIIIVLGLNSPVKHPKNFYLFDDDEVVGDYVGTGMHGGQIFVRGEINNHKLGKEIIKSKTNKADEEIIKIYIDNYFKYFGSENKERISTSDFFKLTPFSRRPYGKLYAY